jgi:hypothetical protein
MLLQARRVRVHRRPRRADDFAGVVGDALPFIEYEVMRQLSHKMRLHGCNAIFNLRFVVTVSDTLVTGVATGTAVHLPCLPTPPPLSLRSTADPPEHATSNNGLLPATSAISAVSKESLEHLRHLSEHTRAVLSASEIPFQQPRSMVSAGRAAEESEDSVFEPAPGFGAMGPSFGEQAVAVALGEEDGLDYHSLLVDRALPEGMYRLQWTFW